MKWKILLAAIGIGVANAFIFRIFEYIVNHGSNWLWNDVFSTDTVRWLVVPLAIILSLGFSLVLRWLKQPRWTKPDTDLFSDGGKPAKTKISDIGSTLAQGASSLLAGASLGPEMSLTESSQQIGKWSAAKIKSDSNTAGVLVASSVGALMVAFIGSMLMVLLPFVLIYQKAKKIPLKAALPIILASLSAYGTLLVIDRHEHGFGSIPVPAARANDYLEAILVAFLISFAAFGLVKGLKYLGSLTERLDKQLPWYMSAGLFGLFIGLLYLVGGQSVQFSGSDGTKLLLENVAGHGAWVFLGLALVKLAATAWSKASGYRGGLFFPSIYVGVALGLFTSTLFTSLAGAGSIVGSIAAIFAALTGSAVFAALIIVALLPIKMLPLALMAIAVALATNKMLSRTRF